jgi:hypothetical protein
MTIAEFIQELHKFPQDLEVVMLSELQGNFVRVKAEPRHIRVITSERNRQLAAVKGVWNPQLHRKEEKGEEVLILW